MNNQEPRTISTRSSTNGTLLYLTELDQDARESLELASQLAMRKGIGLEMIHVVDLVHARPGPDAQMGIQFRLDALANTLRHLKRSVTSVLMFGSQEEVVTKRAQETNVKLIAFPSHGQRSAAAQAAMVKRVGSKVACPVVILNPHSVSASEG